MTAPAQDGFAYRFGWGGDDLDALGPSAAVIVVVDVLRFSTAVCAAAEAGAVVLPYLWDDPEGAAAHAAAHGAMLAGARGDGAASLSPTDLLALEPGTRLVLRSPNGSNLAARAADFTDARVLAGCLRNASAVGDAARRLAGPSGVVAVIAAGERHRVAGLGDDAGPLRPAVEDLLGAGAVFAAIDPSAAVSPPCCSPEAAAARATFADARPRLYETLAACTSGRELIGRGWEDDVATAAAHDVAIAVPELREGAFRAR